MVLVNLTVLNGLNITISQTLFTTASKNLILLAMTVSQFIGVQQPTLDIDIDVVPRTIIFDWATIVMTTLHIMIKPRLSIIKPPQQFHTLIV